MTMKKEQLPKTAKTASKHLRKLLGMVGYNDCDLSTDDGATKLMSRWVVAEACLQRLEIAAGIRKEPKS